MFILLNIKNMSIRVIGEHFLQYIFELAEVRLSAKRGRV